MLGQGPSFASEIAGSIFASPKRLPHVEEDVMRRILVWGPRLKELLEKRGRLAVWLLPATVLCALWCFGGFARISQAAPQASGAMINPLANPMPDANAQMEMREKNLQARNFDLANAERLRDMVKASEMLQTLAIALEVEVDQPGPLSESEIKKAEEIEKLAQIVKERMTLTVGPD
jgi:hypothetical protein